MFWFKSYESVDDCLKSISKDCVVMANHRTIEDLKRIGSTMTEIKVLVHTTPCYGIDDGVCHVLTEINA